MALKLTYPNAFTETANPFAAADPLLIDATPSVLYDFKNLLARASGFDPNAPSFVNLGSYTGVTQITPSMTNFAWDQNRGAIVYAANTDTFTIPVENTTAGQIFNTTDSFLLICWISRRASDLGTFNSIQYLGKGSGNTVSGNHTLGIMNAFTSPSSNVLARMRFATTSGVAGMAATMTGPSTGGAAVQIAMHWSLSGSTWNARFYSNNVLDSEQPTYTNPIWLTTNNLSFFTQFGGVGVKGAGVHRLFIENLSATGRSATSLIAADFTANQSRFPA